MPGVSEDTERLLDNLQHYLGSVDDSTLLVVMSCAHYELHSRGFSLGLLGREGEDYVRRWLRWREVLANGGFTRP